MPYSRQGHSTGEQRPGPSIVPERPPTPPRVTGRDRLHGRDRARARQRGGVSDPRRFGRRSPPLSFREPPGARRPPRGPPAATGAVRSRRSQRGERGSYPGPPGRQRVNDLEVPGTGQLIQFRVIASGAGLREVVTAHATRHPVIGGTVNQAHRAAHRQKLHRIGQAIPVRMPARTTAEQRPGRALAESESVAGHHVTDGGKGHHSAYLPPGHVPARIRRKPVPGHCPQRQVPAGRMPAEEHRPIADQVSAGGLPDEGRQRVHGAGDIVERAGPAAATLATAAELRDAHREPRGRERRRERAGVCPVIGCPPEPSVQEQHQWRRPRARCRSAARHPTRARRRCACPRRRPTSARSARRWQAHVCDMLRPRPIGDHQVRRWGRPGQHVTSCQGASTSHIRPGRAPAPITRRTPINTGPDHPPGADHRRPTAPAPRPTSARRPGSDPRPTRARPGCE